MATWTVCVPITGKAFVEVEADSEEEAIDAALNSEDLTIDAIEEWMPTDRIVQGNFFFGMLNEAYVEQHPSEDDE
jgi:hypothetical protein